MNVSRKFLLIWVAFIVISTSGWLLLQWFFQHDMNELKKQSLVQLKNNTETMLNIRSANLVNLVKDYTYWDDMVRFAESPDSVWAAENLITAMGNYSVDNLWIYNSDGIRVYQHSAYAQPVVFQTTLRKHITYWMKEKTFTHFYHAQPEGIMEMVGAPIHPTSDYKRKTTSRGYMILGRSWTDQYLFETGKLLKSRLTVIGKDSGLTDQEPLASVLSFDLPLHDFDQSVVGYLRIENQWPHGSAFSRLFYGQMVFLLSFIILTLMLTPFLLYRWMIRPLRRISDSLREKQHIQQNSLSHQNNEFGILFRLMESRNQLTKELEETTRRLRDSENQRSLSEEQFRLLFNGLMDGAMVFDSVYYRCLQINPAASRMYGYSIDNLPDIAASDLSDESNLIFEAFEKAKKEGYAQIPCHRQRRTDGTVFFAEISVFFTFWSSAEAFFLIIRDITSRLESETLTQKHLMRQILDISPDYIFVKDRNDQIVLVNESFARLYHCKPEDILGPASDITGHSRFFDETNSASTLQVFEHQREIIIPEKKYTFPDGTYRWLQIIKRPISGPNGEIMYVVSIARDITFHQEAQNNILRLYRLYALLSQINQAIVRNKNHQVLIQEIVKITVQIGNFLFAWYGEYDKENQKYSTINHYGLPEDLALSLIHATPIPKELTDPVILNSADLPEWESDLSLSRLSIHAIALVPILTKLHPESILILYGPESVLDEKEDTELLREIGMDIAFAMDALEADSRRQHLEHQLQILFQAVDQNPVIIMILNSEEHVEYVNQKFTEVSGYSTEEILGKKPNLMKPGFLSKQDFRIMRENLQQGKSWKGEFRNKRKNGEYYWVSALISPFITDGKMDHYIAIMEDITRHKQMETELRQAQKMDSIGRLAGGVAHDFNNLLTAILGYCSLIQQRLPADYPLREDVEAIMQTSRRGANLTRQLLAFSRKQVMHIETLNLNELVQNSLQMLRRIIEENIELQIHLFPEPLYIRVDRSQMEQVLMNLIINARDAIEMNGQIDLTVSEKTHEISGNRMAILSIRDNGSGISPDIRDHIFEPFFTTKEKGKGTGLGLSTVYGIIRQSGGEISIDSEPGKGTVFTIALPLSEETGNGQKIQEILNPVMDIQKTILIVEDDETLCKLIGDILENAGHKALIALNGEQALHLAESYCDRIDLLLTDMILPGINGIDLAEHFRRIHPAIRVLFMSGYPHDKLIAMKSNPEYTGFIQKPFSPDSLLYSIMTLTQ